MQAEKLAAPAKPAKPVPSCAQPIEWFGDNNMAVTMPTTTQRTGNDEHANRRARTYSVRAFPQGSSACDDYTVTPARVFSVAALLFLPLAATACPRTEALTETEAKAEATEQPTAETTPSPTIASPAESEAEEEEDATPEVLARVAARTAAAAAAVRAHRRRLRAHQLAAVAADKSLSRIGPALTHVGPPLGMPPRRPVATLRQSWVQW